MTAHLSTPRQAAGVWCGFGAAKVPVTPDFSQFKQLCRPGRAVPVCAELNADTETAVSAFLKLSSGAEHAFLFESVEGGERIGRWSFLGARPKSVYSYRLGEEGNPFDHAEELLRRHRAIHLPDLPRFTGGLVGHLSYDVIRLLEPKVPIHGPDELGFPDALLMDFDTVVAFDNLRHTAKVVTQARCGPKDDPRRLYAEAQEKIAQVLERLSVPLQEEPRKPLSEVPRLRSRQSRRSFEKGVEKVLQHLRAGDCQQVVLSQRFDAEVDLSPFEIYRALRRVNPSPYLFFLKNADQALVGSSPETLVRVEGDQVVLRPIAGTRKRGKDAREDRALEEDLLSDPKEAAEHAMLVDLGRNDVGRVSTPGTVQVTRYRDVERYSHVLHLVSEVRGQLKKGLSSVDVLKAAFPAGTVSGAPKVSAMEIIDALEPARRGPYAGCVGYMDLQGNLEMAIAIRTLMQSGKRVSVQSGAGIVHASRPAAEYEETLNKARALFAAVAAAGARSLRPPPAEPARGRSGRRS